MDVFTTIVTAIAAFFLVGLIVAGIVGYVIYRAIAGQSQVTKAGIIAGLVLLGLVLMVTVVGADIGVISLLSGVFVSIFSAVRPQGEAEG